MNRTAKLAIKIGLPVLILLGAGGMTARLIASREEPEKTDKQQKAVLVDTQTLERRAHKLDVRASGTVIPARQTDIQPQVGGRVTWLNDSLVPGGIVSEGERLVQIDRSDYQLAVDQQETALQQAKAQLELEEGQQEVAQREWKLFQKEANKQADSDYDPSLALREPQLKSAKAQVEAAKSRLEQARLNLRRTSVAAPFDGFIRQESVEEGQLVGTQSRLATLVGTDAFWVRLSLPTHMIGYIDIPTVNAQEGSMATVHYSLGDRQIEREAQVIRLLGDLDPAGRMARVVVEIDDPLGLGQMEKAGNKTRGIPLLLDAYVDVLIEGNTTEEMVEIPRRALHNGDEVYLYEDGKLAIRTVEIGWRRPDSVLVRSGVGEGAELIVSPLPQPVEGMRLKIGSNDEPTTSDDSTETAPKTEGTTEE